MINQIHTSRSVEKNLVDEKEKSVELLFDI